MPAGVTLRLQTGEAPPMKRIGPVANKSPNLAAANFEGTSERWQHAMKSRFQVMISVTKAIVAVLICFSLPLAGGCKKSSSSQLSTEPSAAPSAKQVAPGPALNACSLLTKEEIQAVQGSLITDTKSSDVSSGSFRTSQCYYLAVESSKSVSLATTQSNPQLNRSVRDYWRETFGGFDGNTNEKEEEAEKEKEEAKQSGGKRKEEEERRPPKKDRRSRRGSFLVRQPRWRSVVCFKERNHRPRKCRRRGHGRR